ncbi:MAG TPA: hypothetical protein VM900_00010 [Sphingomonas sp.]|nr:hypothetical protein [Sphingomonas sp.]
MDDDAVDHAKTFFASNFPSGLLGTPVFTATDKNFPFTPTKTADNQVAGTASMAVPMTIMKMFGSPSQTITVSCEARYDVADSDIMFILDTTASMACAANEASCTPGTTSYSRPDGTGTSYYANEKSTSKIVGLRSAVLKFYDSLAANVDPSTHIRYGFLTYTSTVNVGFLLPASAIVNNADYQSRRVVGDTTRSDNFVTTTSTSQATCNARATGRNPVSYYTTAGNAELVTSAWSNADGGTCVTRTQQLSPLWRYEKVNHDVSVFKTGIPVDDPTRVTNTTSRWQGCVEERETTAGATSFNQAALPNDLNPDLLPDPSDPDTLWRPMWNDVIYYRGSSSASRDFTGSSTNPYGNTTATNQLADYTNMLLLNNISTGLVSCGKPARRLGEMTRTQVSDYVNAVDFKAQGGTYHDTGMIWGTRMIAPNGVFAADTAAWPGRNPPNRYIVFMTDGDMSPNPWIYGLYGIEQYDQRVSGGSGNQANYHNKRFVAECAAAKARGIKVYVVAFGQTLTNELTSCASTPNDAFYADDEDKLDAAFETIAKQVAMLRVSK